MVLYTKCSAKFHLVDQNWCVNELAISEGMYFVLFSRAVLQLALLPYCVRTKFPAVPGLCCFISKLAWKYRADPEKPRLLLSKCSAVYQNSCQTFSQYQVCAETGLAGGSGCLVDVTAGCGCNVPRWKKWLLQFNPLPLYHYVCYYRVPAIETMCAFVALTRLSL